MSWFFFLCVLKITFCFLVFVFFILLWCGRNFDLVWLILIVFLPNSCLSLNPLCLTKHIALLKMEWCNASIKYSQCFTFPTFYSSHIPKCHKINSPSKIFHARPYNDNVETKFFFLYFSKSSVLGGKQTNIKKEFL